MKNKIAQCKLLSLLVLVIGGIFSLVAGQYYYFDAASTSNYPYQQGCSEDLYIRATTDTNITGALAGLLSLKFDATHFSYLTSDSVSLLQTGLFVANTSMFANYSNPTLFPYRVDSGTRTILHIDRYNTLSPFVGTDFYGTIKNIIPKYSPSDYTGTFTIVYTNDTTKTSLSYGGINIINSGYQFTHLTGYFYVYQKPCANDTTAPASTIPTPAGSNKISYLSGIGLIISENAGDLNVPYVRSGGLPGVGDWTGNNRSLNNQYGVNFDTFEIAISGNGNFKYFTGGQFTNGGLLSAVPNRITRQSRDKNFTVDIDPSQLFDYGIEKTITITGRVYDRNGNLSTFAKTFNNPAGPTLIPGSPNPAGGASNLLTTVPVLLGVEDQWAGVDSGTIVVTLSGVNGTNYGPYIFTGTALNLSGVIGNANEPDYYITITGHVIFPSSGHIQVSVYAADMQGNGSSISPWIFTTAPSCADLGCCNNVYLQTGWNPPFFYSGFSLTISGGINPSFTGNGNTGTIYCGTEGQTGTNLYKGTEENSGSAIHITYFDLPELVFSGAINIRAMLSGMTIYLESTNVLAFQVKAYPSNRINQDLLSNNANTGVLKFYDVNKNLVGTSLPFYLNEMGTGRVLVNLNTGDYYVVFKGESHLASYLSGITISGVGEQVFDFTTGTNLYGAQNMDSQTDDGNRYQTAGDLKNTDGDYDFVINGNDISIMLFSTFPELGVGVMNPRNLNGDTAINASDLSVIGSNCLMQDAFAVDGGIFVW